MRLAQKKTYTWLLQNLMHLVTFPQARNVARCAYCALQIRFHDERDIQDVWDSDQSSFLTNIKALESRIWESGTLACLHLVDLACLCLVDGQPLPSPKLARPLVKGGQVHP